MSTLKIIGVRKTVAAVQDQGGKPPTDTPLVVRTTTAV